MRIKADIHSILPKPPNKAGNICLRGLRKRQLHGHSYSLFSAEGARLQMLYFTSR